MTMPASAAGGMSRLSIQSDRIYPNAWLALAELDAVMVPIVPGSSAREVAFFLADGDVEADVVEAGLLGARSLAPGDGGLRPAARTVVVGGD